MTNVDTNTLC